MAGAQEKNPGESARNDGGFIYNQYAADMTWSKV
jgi:hypothetical protein